MIDASVRSTLQKGLIGEGAVADFREPLMLVEMTELLGRQVYTQDGRLLGEVENVVVDVESSKIDGLYIGETSPLLVDESKPVNVPYRWVASVNDVVLLKYFPKRVSVKKSPARPAKAEGTPTPAR